MAIFEIAVTEIFNLDPANPSNGTSVTVTVPVGSNGIDVMDAAALEDRRFYYTSLNGSKWGAQIVGIGNVMVEPSGSYYFQLLVGRDLGNLQPSSEGISSYIPPPDSIIKWSLTPYAYFLYWLHEINGQCKM